MNPDAITLLYAAHHAPMGIWVRVPDMVRAKTLLYTARAKLKDPDLMSIIIRTSPRSPTDTLWLMKAS